MRFTINFILFFTICTISFSSDAHVFRHLELKGALKTINKFKGKSKDEADVEKVQLAQQEIAKKLLNLDEVIVKSPSNKGILPGESEERYSLIFKKVKELIGDDLESLGESQSSPLALDYNLGGGVQNFSGFSWHKPQTNFQLYANRELAPDLFSERWIVHDTFVIKIEASSLITNMRELDLIEITDEGISAFAGMQFQRTYHYWHFAETFLKGLQADYSKLFLSFLYFNAHHILNMDEYELMRREDQFSINAGGTVTSPPYYGMSFNGGVIANVSFKNEVSAQAIGAADFPKKEEFLRISQDKSYNVGADIHLGLQLDFFNLLKLSLLSYDLDYDYAESKKLHLSFYEKDRSDLSTDSGNKEFKSIINGHVKKINFWKKNIIQMDERVKQNLNSKYAVLLFGNIRKKETEQINVIKDGVEKTFYRNYSSTKKIVQNLWSRLFGSIIHAIFDFNSSIKNSAELERKMTIEYEKTQSQVHSGAYVKNSEEFSVELVYKFFAAKTHRWQDKFYRNQALYHLGKYTNLDEHYLMLIESDKLRGPMQLTTTLRVESRGLKYFNFLPESEVFYAIASVCKSKKRHKWVNPQKRAKMLKRLQFGKDACVKSIAKRYLKYSQEYHRYGDINLNSFKRFLGSYFKKIRSYHDIYLLFGTDNVFLNGNLSATTDDGAPFQNYYKSGQFRGLGVIDSYMRQGGTIVPVPIRD
jgi:hypothetical protein